MHRFRMGLDQLAHCDDLLRHPHADESNDAGMLQAPHKDELTEVLVFGNEHPVFPIRQCKQGFIRSSRIYLPS